MDDIATSGGRALILVVERDPHVQALERFFLEEAGFEVEIAADGERALELATARRPAILVTEVLVPRVDGFELCRTVKRSEPTRDIRILVLSILSVRQRALEAGADAFLQKPLNDAELIEAVRALVARAKNRSRAP